MFCLSGKLNKVIAFAALCLSLCFAACSTTPEFIQSGLIVEKQQEITKREIFKLLSENGIFSQETQFPDVKYVLPIKSWVKNEFSQSFGLFLQVFNGVYFQHENWDCDDFSKAANFYSSVLHYKSQKHNAGFAFGEIHYLKTSGVGHAANLFIYKELGRLKLGFYEPQGRFLMELTDKEKQTIFFIRF